MHYAYYVDKLCLLTSILSYTHIPYHCMYIYITITGVQIEEPFGILPMAYICNNIKDMGVELLQDTGIELTVPPSPPVVPVVFPGYSAVTSTSTGHNSDPVYHTPVNIMPPIRDASMLTIINGTADIALHFTTTNATSTAAHATTTASLLHTDSSNDSNSIARLVPILTPSEVQDILSAVPFTNTTDGLTDGLTGGLIGGVYAEFSSGREGREEGLSGSPLCTSSGTGNRILEPVGALNQQDNNTSDTNNNTNSSNNSIMVDDNIIHIQLVTTEMFLDSLEEKKS